MTAHDAADAVIFGREGLDRLVEVLIADGYQVIGPTVRDSAIVLDRLDSAAALPAGWGCGYRSRLLPAAPAGGCRGVRELGRAAVVEAVPASAAALPEVVAAVMAELKPAKTTPGEQRPPGRQRPGGVRL